MLLTIIIYYIIIIIIMKVHSCKSMYYKVLFKSYIKFVGFS